MVTAVVAADPDWARTERSLASLAAQNYPQLSVVVVCDANSGGRDQREQITQLLAEAIVTEPEASVSRFTGRPKRLTVSALHNHGAGLARGSEFLAFVRAGVTLAPDAISLLVTDAVSASGGVVGAVGPKVLDADDGATLIDLGGTVDRLGTQIAVIGAEELDQAQHDEARDLFVAPTAALLVRREVFMRIGGFDTVFASEGAAIDLCWRIQLSGARVRVAPGATAKATAEPDDATVRPSRRQREYRARLRTVTKCYGWVHLLPILAFAAVLAAGEAVWSMVRGRFSQASDVALAWLWNFRHMGSGWRLRRAAKRYRRVRDSDLRRRQQGGSARVTDWLRYRLSPEGSEAARITLDESIFGTWRRNTHRAAAMVWLAVLAVVAFGSRGLLTDGVAAFGQFAAFADSSDLVGAYLDGWRPNGAGSVGIGPTALGLVGLGSTVLLGAAGLLRYLAIWGLLVLGLWGIWRLCSLAALPRAARTSAQADPEADPEASADADLDVPVDELAGAVAGRRNGQLAALVLYAACPLPYNALASGRWDVLLAYGTAPLIVAAVMGLMTPRAERPVATGTRRTLPARVASLGLLLAVVGAFEPFIVVLAVAAAAVIAAAELVRRVVRKDSAAAPIAGLGCVLVAAALAAIAQLPWLLEFDSAQHYLDTVLGSPTVSTPTSLAELLRFQTGPLGDLPLSWGLLLVAAIPLFIGMGDRFWTAARGWLVGLGGFAVAWYIARGWADELFDDVAFADSLAETALAFGAVGLCWAASAAPASLAATHGGTTPRVRTAVTLVGAIGLVAMAAPTAWASLGGDWSAPRFDHQVPLRLIDDRDLGPDYRVLWIGAPEVLPLRGTDTGIEGIAAGTSVRGYPDIRHQWTAPPTAGDDRLIEAVRLGLEGETLRMGRLLGAFGIRYVVLMERSGPSYGRGWDRPVPTAAAESLASQIDLRPLATDPSVQVYRNEAWWSSRSQFSRVLPGGFATEPADVVVSDLTDGVGVLTEHRSATHQVGPLAAGTVLVADTYSPNWRLDVADESLAPALAMGWAMRFDPRVAGPAELRFERPPSVTARVSAQALVWLTLAWVAIGQPTPFVDRLSARYRRSRAS